MIETSPSPSPIFVNILLLDAVPAQADNTMLARASTDTSTNNFDFMILSPWEFCWSKMS
jgi:hypothetical protein